MQVLDIIKPVQLLRGSHSDTGQTGQGCFMNVIAYLNGEPQITDQSKCVCVTVRKVAIWLNDYMNSEERKQLLPFVMRAMGSATDDKVEMKRRLGLLVEFAGKQKKIAAVASASASASAAASAAADAYADAYADASAAASAAADADASADAAADASAAADAAADADADAAADAAADADAAASAYAPKYKTRRAEIIKVALDYLDAVLPPATEPQQIHIERAQKLAALAA